jgi:hypothetical protein
MNKKEREHLRIIKLCLTFWTYMRKLYSNINKGLTYISKNYVIFFLNNLQENFSHSSLASTFMWIRQF